MNNVRRASYVNAAIKAFFFILFPAAWATGFSGIKYLCQQIHSGKPLAMSSFLMCLVALLVFTFLFGRFFCGKACAFGTYGDVLYEGTSRIVKAAGKKMPILSESAQRKMRFIKYGVLIAVGLLCIAGYDSAVSGGSPWTFFSQIRAGHFGLADSEKDGGAGLARTLGIMSIVLFIACSVGMMVYRRFFCRFLCPFGAVFSLMPVLPISRITRKKSDCLAGCKACKNICPVSLDLPYSEVESTTPTDPTHSSAPTHRQVSAGAQAPAESTYAQRMGECIQCGRCTQICPKQNAGCLTTCGGTKGMALDVAKAAVLAGILYLLN